MRLFRIALLLPALFAATLAFAQAVHWEAGDSALGNMVQLVFEDCEPDGAPQLPPTPNFALAYRGTSSSINVVNLSVSRTVVLTYEVQAKRGGPLQIPAFTIKTSKGQIRVAPFNGAAPSVAAESVATARLVPERTTVWAGEVFSLTYQLVAPQRNNPQFGPGFSFEWSASPFIAEEWGSPTPREATVDGQRSLIIGVPTRIYTKSSGSVPLDAAHQVINVQTGMAGFGLFSQPRMEPVSITSDQPTIEVRPLPEAPAGFTGAVGQFKLTSTVVPKEAAVGEPVTWTLELSGTGNWPDISGLPAREASKDFQVVQPKAKRTTAEGKLFDATLTEDVVLVPTKPGNYTLGPTTFTFFNPRTGSYETLKTERTTIKISPVANVPAASAPTAEGRTPDTAATTPTHTAVAPASPAGIPRDPLPGKAETARPMSTGTLIVWLATPISLLVVLWLALAYRRAAQTDPLRAKREAHARLGALLAEMSGDLLNSKLPDRLLRWQHDTAVLFGIPHAAPNAEALAKAPKTDPAQAGIWSTLWQEADRALYGATASLPADWVSRAQAALAAKRVPGFQAARLFLPRNLLAFAAALLGFLVLLPSVSHAATPAAAPEVSYRAGDFGVAETAWRAAVAERPTDWVARHNLSLALAQQDRTGESLAQAAAAFVQHPDHPAVRWHLALMADKAGFVPAPLLPLLKEGPAASVVTLAGPAQWQRILIVAAFAVALMLGWMLVNAYGARSRGQTRAAVVGCGLAVLLGLCAIFGLVSYGEIADARAAITWQPSTLRSIPTEADTTQKTTALPPGSVAIVDRTFLNHSWNHVTFANGQTGWVRKEDTIPLWR